jgi:hypothetical protein
MNGCYNRKPLRRTVLAQDGWVYLKTHPGFVTRMPKMVRLPDPMSKDCQYSIHTVDPKCAGCKWNQREFGN